ncbi:MAG TPA: response regulator [Opitutaceae bacterium]|nr:response regulator [Opitutaceae bacterium]
MSGSSADLKVLVIDDEYQIRRLLKLSLETQGFQVYLAENGEKGLREAAISKPDIIVVDLSLPDMPGLEVLQRIREWTEVPIIVLSARGDEAAKIAALDAGADDYVTKPFGTGELFARIRVLMRRRNACQEPSIIKFGNIEVDLATRIVLKLGREIKFTRKEYALLRLFILNRGKVITYGHILREIWSPIAQHQTHYLRVYVAHLRQKLEDEPKRPKYFLTESGVGYRLAA